jgi:excinuclease ABC subunit C
VAFAFEHRVAFVAEDSDEILRAVPAAPGVFALRGADPAAEPYLTRAADLRRRMRRLLAPPEAVDEQGRPVLSKRLNLRERVSWIEWTRTGSEFESALVLYGASQEAFGAAEARRRMRLYPPYMLRVTMAHAHPRVYATNRLNKRSLEECFGPFPSRASAERYCDAVLDLFLLRRCHEDLAPYPEHPGCVYGEMNKCMRPCQEGAVRACTAEEYAAEAGRVFAFFRTRGQSLLDEVAAQREAASEATDFEAAAGLHKHWEKVRAAALLADELVRPVAELRAVVVQEAAPRADEPRTEDAAVFLLERGWLAGPERLSTLGVRAVREQTAVGSSLFAQPLMLAAIPLEESAEAVVADAVAPEDRARTVLAGLAEQTEADVAELCDALSLFRRWYYRPEKQRAGEVFLPNADGSWPVRRILNGSARVVLGPPVPAPAVDREAAKVLKTKIIHPGREGVEREVPVLPKRARRRKAITPADIAD